MPVTNGPSHLWFAWRPVNTTDRGWTWLRAVVRNRVVVDIDGHHGRRWRYRSLDILGGRRSL